jgi:PiT family inorganic phosphate transporter
VLIPSLLAPAAGLVGAALLMTIVLWLIRKRAPAPVNRLFRRLQLVSGGFVAFTHGTNDAQKTMGVIALALIVSGHLAAEPFTVPLWVKISSATVMALGTYAGGWRIIRTLGTRIAKLEPPQGFAAQTSTAVILWVTARYGFPVSTTYTISGSVLGAGASTRLSAVRWGVAGNILVAWIITIPCAGLVAAAMEYVTRLPGGVALVFLLTAGIAALAFSGRKIEARREARRYRLASAPAPS